MEATKYGVHELQAYYRNARRGNVAAIAESLRVNGQYKPIVVNLGTHTGREHEVLVGNHTLQAARELGWEQIDAVVIDVDEEHAARIVLADNRTSDLGVYDDELLAELLQDQESLEGTAFDQEYLDDLVAHLSPPSLDELAEHYGEPTEADLYVTWQVKVPETTAKALSAALERFAGEPHEQAAQLADVAARAKL